MITRASRGEKNVTLTLRPRGKRGGSDGPREREGGLRPEQKVGGSRVYASVICVLSRGLSAGINPAARWTARENEVGNPFLEYRGEGERPRELGG